MVNTRRILFRYRILHGSTYVSIGVSLRVTSDFRAGLEGLIEEEEAWATRNGLTTSYREVPEFIKFSRVTFVREYLTGRKTIIRPTGFVTQALCRIDEP